MEGKPGFFERIASAFSFGDPNKDKAHDKRLDDFRKEQADLIEAKARVEGGMMVAGNERDASGKDAKILEGLAEQSKGLTRKIEDYSGIKVVRPGEEKPPKQDQ